MPPGGAAAPLSGERGGAQGHRVRTQVRAYGEETTNKSTASVAVTEVTLFINFGGTTVFTMRSWSGHSGDTGLGAWKRRPSKLAAVVVATVMGLGERVWLNPAGFPLHCPKNTTETSVAFTCTTTSMPTSAGPDTRSPGRRSADPVAARPAISSVSTITTTGLGL